MKHWQGLCAWVLCGLWLAACGGIDTENYGEEYGEALCHRQARCGEIRDEDACASARRDVYEALAEVGLGTHALYEGSLTAGRARFDEDAAGKCLDLIRDSSCDQSLDEVTSAEVCRFLFGQRKDGEACLVKEDCGAASYCSRGAFQPGHPVCEAGTCKPLPRQGEPLTGADNVHACAPGLSPDVSSVCQPTSGEGGPCMASHGCASGLTCDEDLHQCRRPFRVGESCDAGARRCLPHLRCAEGSCRTLADVGESCTLSRSFGASWTSDCKRDLFCDAAPDSTQGTCEERLGKGSSCRDYRECGTGFFCDLSAGQTGTCRELVSEGGKCDTLPASWASCASPRRTRASAGSRRANPARRRTTSSPRPACRG